MNLSYKPRVKKFLDFSFKQYLKIDQTLKRKELKLT